MASIALRNLWARKLRTFLTGFAVILGVMMIAGTYVLTDTIERSFDEIFTESNEGVDAVVTSKSAVDTDDGDEPPIPASILADVESVDGVAAGLGGDHRPADGDHRLRRRARRRQRRPRPRVLGRPRALRPARLPGGRPAQVRRRGRDRPRHRRGSGIRARRPVTIAGSGDTRRLRLVGTATLGGSEALGGATIAVMTLPTAQQVTGKEGQFDLIRVAADDSTSPEQLAANLTAALPGNVEAETGEEDTESQKDDINEGLGFLKTALLVFAGVSLFVASFLIFNTFSITVAQRTREFAMLRTLGANRRQIITAVIGEALLIGLFASLVGLLPGSASRPCWRASSRRWTSTSRSPAR